MPESLFDFGPPEESVEEPVVDPPARDEQVAKIRSEFERLNISSQDERKQVIESAVFRDVPSLRHLTAVEARRVLDRLKDRKGNAPTSTGSSWDTRGEPTRIDKL